jgi:hypothetical protein
MYISVQADSKFSQIQQRAAKTGPSLSKKKAWIPFDRLVRIEPFQGLAPIKGPKIPFPSPFLG